MCLAYSQALNSFNANHSNMEITFFLLRRIPYASAISLSVCSWH